jgi:hypothetical protein
VDTNCSAIEEVDIGFVDDAELLHRLDRAAAMLFVQPRSIPKPNAHGVPSHLPHAVPDALAWKGGHREMLRELARVLKDQRDALGETWPQSAVWWMAPACACQSPASRVHFSKVMVAAPTADTAVRSDVSLSLSPTQTK